MLRVLVVEGDDEAYAVLARQLARYFARRDIDFRLTRWDSASGEGPDSLRHDVLVVDTDTDDGQGLTLARRLRALDEDAPILIVSSDAGAAMEGYGIEAVGYLVWPITEDALARALGRAERRFRAQNEGRFSAHAAGRIVLMDVDDTAYVKVDGHYLSFYHRSGRRLEGMRGSLADAERVLPSGQFVRVSHECLINMACVKALRANGVVMTDGAELAFSRTYRARARARLEGYYDDAAWGDAQPSEQG